MALPTGRLFVGHAESSLCLNAGWLGVRIPFTFAYKKAIQPAAQSITPDPTIALKNPAIAPDPVRASGRSPQPADPAIVPNPAPTDHLLQARQSADRGDFAIAKQLCAQQLQTDPLQPEIHLLLGQIHQAQDQTTIAETYFTKTLYLQPDCLEALIHLARLKQHQGNQTAADRLYQRIDRLKAQDTQ